MNNDLEFCPGTTPREGMLGRRRVCFHPLQGDPPSRGGPSSGAVKIDGVRAALAVSSSTANKQRLPGGGRESSGGAVRAHLGRRSSMERLGRKDPSSMENPDSTTQTPAGSRCRPMSRSEHNHGSPCRASPPVAGGHPELQHQTARTRALRWPTEAARHGSRSARKAGWLPTSSGVAERSTPSAGTKLHRVVDRRDPKRGRAIEAAFWRRSRRGLGGIGRKALSSCSAMDRGSAHSYQRAFRRRPEHHLSASTNNVTDQSTTSTSLSRRSTPSPSSASWAAFRRQGGGRRTWRRVAARLEAPPRRSPRGEGKPACIPIRAALATGRLDRRGWRRDARTDSAKPPAAPSSRTRPGQVFIQGRNGARVV